MELVPEPLELTLTELQIVNTKECLHHLLDAQRAIFHSQIDQLQRIVITQCQLTGVNPLSQEMAAGALSIKIGKKPRDLLNPKAIKNMQSIFSIKDTISKKETREISALCGVTITQVRDFFASQRSRVRKIVRLSREKAIMSSPSAPVSTSSFGVDHADLVSRQTCNATVHPMNVVESREDPVNSVPQFNTLQQASQTLNDHVDMNCLSENVPCSTKDESKPGVDSAEENFMENILVLMRKEETFSGQVKLMESILQIHNVAVLQWFLTKGGMMILATWLSQATLEEQTTVLLIIFKVLCHLPLHKALPAQMSAILQTVNKLRFYRTSDISNKARVLLSRWSKMFVRSQALKRPLSVKYPIDTHKEIVRKQRISEILSDESWLSKVDLPEDVLTLAYEDSEDMKGDSKNTLKLLPATCNDLSKKQARSVSCPKTKERRKVLLVDQPDHKPAGRSGQTMRAVPAKSSRPMSADDIQKAKMHAIFMQRKYGNTDTAVNQKGSVNQKTSDTSQANGKLFPSLPKLGKDEDKKLTKSATECSASQQVSTQAEPTLSSGDLKTGLVGLPVSKSCIISQESLSEKLKNGHVTWHMPAVIKMNSMWSLGSGENSKEMEVQTARIRREKETFYRATDEIPANPKDPWDIEMDFDDSLTPVIPTDPPPDADGADAEATVGPDAVGKDDSGDGTQHSATSVPVTAEAPPDLELLAVLLKNPDVVFALTSGQRTNLINAETMALLDVLKKSSGGLPGMLSNGPALPAAAVSLPSPMEPPISLPSPTPPSERTRMGWRSEPGNSLQLRHELPAAAIMAVPPRRSSPPPAPLLLSPSLPSNVPPLARAGLTSTTPKLPEISLSSPPRLPRAQLPPPISSPSMRHGAPPFPMRVSQRFYNSEADPTPSKHRRLDAGDFPLVREENFPLDRMQRHHLPTVTAGTAPPLLPTPSRLLPPPPPLRQEPPARSPRVPPRWSPGAVASSGNSRELTIDSWHGRLNGMLDAQIPRHLESTNRRGANIHAVAPGRMHSDDLLDRSELEPWSPERSPSMGSPEYPISGSRGFGERKGGTEYGRSRSRQYHPGAGGHRDRHRSGRRWRDRDRRP